MNQESLEQLLKRFPSVDVMTPKITISNDECGWYATISPHAPLRDGEIVVLADTPLEAVQKVMAQFQFPPVEKKDNHPLRDYSGATPSEIALPDADAVGIVAEYLRLRFKEYDGRPQEIAQTDATVLLSRLRAVGFVRWAKDQTLPPAPVPVDMDATHAPLRFRDGYKMAQQDMLKAGFRRVQPEVTG